MVLLPRLDGRAISSISHSLARLRLCERPPWCDLWEAIAEQSQVISPLYLRYIPAISPLCLPYISPISRQGRLAEFDALSLSSLALAFATARQP